MYTTSAVLFLIGITSLTNGAQMVRKTSMKRRIARDKASLIRNGGVILVQANDVLETAQRCAVDNIQPCLNALQAISTEHVIAYGQCFAMRIPLHHFTA